MTEPKPTSQIPTAQSVKPERELPGPGKPAAEGGGFPWALAVTEVITLTKTDPVKGLDRSEAGKRLRHYGPNEIRSRRPRSAWRILAAQFKNLIFLLLLLAAAISFALAQPLEGVSILVAMLINVIIGFGTEIRAVRSIESLKQMARVKAAAMREGRIRKIPAADLVPGDIIVLEGGDMIPADLRLIEANGMQADESALTGESVPVEKGIDSLPENTLLAERSNMLFKGTALIQGSGRGVVVSTGMSTELGRIADLAGRAQKEALTPLEHRLNRLGQRLIFITLGIAVCIALAGWMAGVDMLLILKAAIALSVAAIPEGLPVVATIALARGMWRMARRNALVNRLSSVETLGSTNIICTDKTGTLTENRMTVTTLVLPAKEGIDHIAIDPEKDPPFSGTEKNLPDEDLRERVHDAVIIGVLCNNAQFSADEEHVGDPLEIALLRAGELMGFKRESLLKEYPEEKEAAFSAETNMMATWHRMKGTYLVAVKGAPEAVIEASGRMMTHGGETDLSAALRDELLQANQELAGKGLRMLALARKSAEDIQGDPYSSLTFVGLVGLLDPPRKGVKEVISVLGKAGVRVVMVTGDHPGTASYIGRELGLTDENGTVIHGEDLGNLQDLEEGKRQEIMKGSIFARISPEQKLNLVALFQSDGSIVAMTGDGVNDAPALTKADIGVAMGMRGTQVAREASDIVLKDDAFGTIALAVEQGRIIFRNIRKFIVYLLSGNVGAILIVGLAMLFGGKLPLLPLQILYLNMISDVFPALALGVGTGERSVMEEPPRPSREPIIPKALWLTIALYGALIAATVLLSFWIAQEKMLLSSERSVTISFLTLAFIRTWHVFNMRDSRSHPVFNDVTRNPYVWGAVILSVGLLMLAVYWQPLAHVLSMAPPAHSEWVLILGMSLIPLAAVQLLKQIRFFGPLG